jgi:CheY-like chemotaxis protein
VVLVVDDEKSVRQVARRILQEAGYRVIEARHGGEALTMLGLDTPVDLMIADLKMPVMEGDEVARRFRIARPDLKVLYLSGFVDRLFDTRSVLWEGEAFLEKPFTAKGLLEAVSMLRCGHLEERPHGPGGVPAHQRKIQPPVWTSEVARRINPSDPID